MIKIQKGYPTPAKAKFVTDAQKIEFWEQLPKKRYINNNRKKYYKYTKDALYSHTKIKENMKGKLYNYFYDKGRKILNL